jgi:hypothetical protein
MYFDSGASRSVISTTSPIRQHLHAVRPTYGSCSIGDGTPLHYLKKENVTENLELTVVQDLRYDLFSSVRAAKQGLTSILTLIYTLGRTTLTLSTSSLETSRPWWNEARGYSNYPFT